MTANSLFMEHILSLLLLLPLSGALLIALVPGNRAQLIRGIALLTALMTMALALLLLDLFDASNPAVQLFEQFIWNPRLGTSYAVGVDGISLPMVLLAALLCLVAIMASGGIKERVKGYYLLILVLETAMMGVFMAQDWAIFYVFWEMTLIPLFFLIDRWGGKNRQMASLNFVLYTMGGSVFMLISLLVLFDATPNHSFAMAEMMKVESGLSEAQQIMIFLGLLIGFGVKMPVFPLHGWLPLAHVEAPAPISILLSGILLKMGAYGIIRAAAMLPDAVNALQNLLLALAMISIIYGGLLAWKQRDLKKMIAYSSVSHMGVVLLGIATLSEIGMSGAIAQMVAHGLVAGATFLLIGLLYERTHTRDLADYSSLIRVTPRFAFFLTLAFIAAIGFPGTFGFVAELHVLIAGFQEWGWLVIILTLGVLISAVYATRTIGRLFTGPTRDNMRDVEDLRLIETIAATMLVAGVIALGVMPGPMLELSSAAITQFSGVF